MSSDTENNFTKNEGQLNQRKYERNTFWYFFRGNKYN